MVNRVVLVDSMREAEEAVKAIEAAPTSMLTGIRPPKEGESRYAVHTRASMTSSPNGDT